MDNEKLTAIEGKMLFKEHGVFEVSVEGKLLLVNAKGPFNEQLVNLYQQALETCIATLQQYNNWSQIIVMHHLSLFTPEAEHALINSLIDRKLKGLSFSAVVLVNAEGQSLIEQQMARIYQCAGITFKFFDSVETAKLWIKDR